MLHRAPHERNLDLAPEYQGDGLLRVGHPCVERHLRIPLGELHGEPGKEQLPWCRRNPHGEPSARPGLPGHALLKLRNLGEDTARVPRQMFPRWCGAHRPPPGDERHPEALLQRMHVVGDGRLRHPQLPSRRRERTTLQYAQEHAKSLQAYPHRIKAIT